jgi:LmbE family N-acetylglucosaminyl deacetylase
MRASFVLLIALASAALAQDGKLRVIAFGAHPDDADIRAGGIAAMYAAKGHHVKFVSVTNGDAGHCKMGGGELANRRRAEATESARKLGIDAYDVLDNHDGELMPSLEVRKEIIRLIRAWKADIVLAPRTNDYHPDHRYTGVLVQDAAFMVLIPMVVTDTPPLKRNPVFFYYEDNFQKPAPFKADIAISIDSMRRSNRSSTRRNHSAGAATSPSPRARSSGASGSTRGAAELRRMRLARCSPNGMAPTRPRRSVTPRPSSCASTAAVRPRPR